MNVSTTEQSAVILVVDDEQPILQAQVILGRVMQKFGERNYDGTTLSIGIVGCRRDTSLDIAGDIHRMQIDADQAMYDAKHSGKNRIICRT